MPNKYSKKFTNTIKVGSIVRLIGYSGDYPHRYTKYLNNKLCTVVTIQEDWEGGMMYECKPFGKDDSYFVLSDFADIDLIIE